MHVSLCSLLVYLPVLYLILCGMYSGTGGDMCRGGVLWLIQHPTEHIACSHARLRNVLNLSEECCSASSSIADCASRCWNKRIYSLAEGYGRSAHRGDDQEEKFPYAVSTEKYGGLSLWPNTSITRIFLRPRGCSGTSPNNPTSISS